MDYRTEIELLQDKAKAEKRDLTPTEKRRVELWKQQARMQAQEKSRPDLSGLLPER